MENNFDYIEYLKNNPLLKENKTIDPNFKYFVYGINSKKIASGGLDREDVKDDMNSLSSHTEEDVSKNYKVLSADFIKNSLKIDPYDSKNWFDSLEEMSMTGGGVGGVGASFTPGEGMQDTTPKAFKKTKKKTNIYKK